jgi:coenzyme Q-binding protein COQ10
MALTMFKERFAARVALHHYSQIHVEHGNGPFRYLNNHWRFLEAEDGGSVIDFYVDCEFRSRVLPKLIGLLFNEAVSRMVGAFETRARQLHGERATSAGAASPCRPGASRAQPGSAREPGSARACRAPSPSPGR